jgi:UDP-glucose-4-epimerase GalE
MILVTGGAGYIGSHTVREILREGDGAIVLDNLVYGHEWAVPPGVKLVRADIADTDALTEIFTEHEVDSVIHFAAYAYVGESVKDPAKYYRNNIAGSIAMLDAMARAGVGRIVFSSSCATYGIPDSLPITEDLPQRPISPYGMTKYVFERILADYDRAYGLKYAALRYFNAAGASPDAEIGEDHDPETHIIPLLIDSACTGREFRLFGTDYPTRDGSCERDYIHVTDLATAHTAARRHLTSGGDSVCVNLGTGTGVTNLELVRTVEEVTGRRVNLVKADRREGDPAALVASNTKARDVLKWTPGHSDIRDIVETAYNWYIKHRNGGAS